MDQLTFRNNISRRYDENGAEKKWQIYSKDTSNSVRSTCTEQMILIERVNFFLESTIFDSLLGCR